MGTSFVMVTLNDVAKNEGEEAMRGADVMQEELFAVKRLDEFVPKDHPLRAVRDILNAALTKLDADFDSMYASTGRDSIAPEKLRAHSCCKHSMAFAPSARCASIWNTTCFIAHRNSAACRHPDASRGMGSLQFHA